VQAIRSRDLTVKSVEAKPASRNPSAPFMTSTLQQEASRKFGMGARQTMSAAQRLYEAGHITYMRTDGIDMAPEAVMAARDAIRARFGEKYLPDSPRMYKNKAKNAQEAHECIRPTDMDLDPGKLKLRDDDQRKLYDLIWKRTIASQMAAARLERTTVDVASPTGRWSCARRAGRAVRRVPPHLRGGRATSPRARTTAACRRSCRASRPRSAASRPSSTSPSRRRATPRRRW
jgi:DNA topoisomerase I